MIKLINFLIVSVTIISFAGCVTTKSHDHSQHKKLKFGAPTEGMSTEEYQSLIFLDPQNTIRSDYHAVKGVNGNFLIDNQGQSTISVVNYYKGETVKKINLTDPPENPDFKMPEANKKGGNHHIWMIPGLRYAWSSQAYQKDIFWTIDLKTQKVVDTFRLSMNGKAVIAPLHVGFAYTKPLAVVGNIKDKKKGYLTLLSTATRRPIDIVEISCPGARDAMFSMDDSKVFTTCQNEPKGMAVIDVDARKEIKMVPIKGGRAGGMDAQGKYFMVSASNSVHLFDTKTTERVKIIKVPGGGGNFTCLKDGSKCYVGLRKANAVGVIDMAKLELMKTIETGPNANRLYLNPANSRYGLFTNESGKSDIVSIIDTQKDVKIKDIWTGLGPHNVAFDPNGKFAVISTKKENVATLVDTASTNPNDWDVITTDLDSGIQNNGVRWVPSPAALKRALASN